MSKSKTNPLHHVRNKVLFPENFTYHMLLLFYPFRDENELLSSFPPMYQKKIDFANINKIKFESCRDLIDKAFSQFYETLINNQDPRSHTENHESPGAEHPKEMIQKTHKQKNPLKFPASYHKYKEMIKLQKE